MFIALTLKDETGNELVLVNPSTILAISTGLNADGTENECTCGECDPDIKSVLHFNSRTQPTLEVMESPGKIGELIEGEMKRRKHEW